MDDRHLKRFDLPEPKAEAHFGHGRHIDLSQTMLEQTLLADSTVYGFTERAAVAFAKATDETLLDAIVKKAKENGITFVMVTHERDLAGVADRIITIRDGKVESNILVDEQEKARKQAELFKDILETKQEAPPEPETTVPADSITEDDE